MGGPPLVVSGGAGGQYHLLPAGLSAESGVAFQITPPLNVCGYTQMCHTVGPGTIAGGLGIAGALQLGGNNLCSGTQKASGAFVMTPGFAGQATVGEDGALSGQKGMLQLGSPFPGGAGGYVSCTTEYYCLR